MPSRPAIALIIAFWLGTLGFAFYRDVWPRIAASGPPPLSVDLAEEASPNVWVKWTVYRGDRKVGRLTTHMSYHDADDTFEQRHDYQQLEMQVGETIVSFPRLSMITRVTRSGELREQTLEGTLVARTPTGSISAEARVHGIVQNGQFVSRCIIKSEEFDFDESLDPVPVPKGHALNPLQVVGRITELKPGRHWVVDEIDPLRDAVAALINGQLKKIGLPTLKAEKETFVARVSSSPEDVNWKGLNVSCWVIEYRGRETRVKTWVRESDGRVLRQEVSGRGERFVLERDE